jgi:hypothetical protein
MIAMKRIWLLLLTGAAGAFSALVVMLAGCGGSGGPITLPETGPAPSISAQFTALLPAVQRTATFVGSNACAPCHGGRDVLGIHAAWSETTHAQRNVGCEQCHGPGSVHVANPSKENILTGPNATSDIVCGQCHGPTHEQWKNSRHAGVIEEVIEEGAQVPEIYVRTCFRCHSGAFRALHIDAKLSYGKTADEVHAAIQAMTREELLNFVAESHNSATCVTCHDPHRRTSYLTSAGNQAHLRYATFNTDATGIAPGASVASHTTYNHICARCHNGRGANPSDAALTTGTARPNMHNSNQHNMLLGIGGVEGTGPVVRTGSHTQVPDQCVHCHMPNRRHTFTVSFDISCAPCHTAADAAARAGATRSEIQNGLLALRTRLERWAQDTFGQPELWNYTSLITEAGLSPPPQSQVPIQIKRARHNYYFVLRDKSFGIHNLFYTRYLLTVANEQLDALGVSRAPSRANLSPERVKQILQTDLERAKAADMRGHVE